MVPRLTICKDGIIYHSIENFLIEDRPSAYNICRDSFTNGATSATIETDIYYIFLDNVTKYISMEQTDYINPKFSMEDFDRLMQEAFNSLSSNEDIMQFYNNFAPDTYGKTKGKTLVVNLHMGNGLREGSTKLALPYDCDSEYFNYVLESCLEIAEKDDIFVHVYHFTINDKIFELRIKDNKVRLTMGNGIEIICTDQGNKAKYIRILFDALREDLAAIENLPNTLFKV